MTTIDHLTALLAADRIDWTAVEAAGLTVSDALRLGMVHGDAELAEKAAHELIDRDECDTVPVEDAPDHGLAVYWTADGQHGQHEVLCGPQSPRAALHELLDGSDDDEADILAGSFTVVYFAE